MARRPKTWEDIGNVMRRQAGRSAQMAADAAWRAAHSQIIVPDGATLDSMAQQTGATPEGFLEANPGVNNIKTGMVLNVPNMGAPGAYRPGASPVPGSEAWRVQNVGGLPSNAALGGATTNPRGWNGEMGFAPRTQQTTDRFRYNNQGSPFSSPPPRLPGSDAVANFLNLQNSPQLWNPVTTGPLGALGNMVNSATQQAIGSTAPAQQPRTNNYVQRTSNQMLNELKYRVESGMQITPDMLQFMLRKNMLTPPVRPPSPTVTTGGGGGYGRGRGRGGRGGGGGARRERPHRHRKECPPLAAAQALVVW